MKLRVLFTIPNFDTAGSGLALFNLASSLNVSKFDLNVLFKHSKGEIFKVVESSHLTVHVFDYDTPMRLILKGLKGAFDAYRKLRESTYSFLYYVNVATFAIFENPKGMFTQNLLCKIPLVGKLLAYRGIPFKQTVPQTDQHIYKAFLICLTEESVSVAKRGTTRQTGFKILNNQPKSLNY